MQQEMLPPLFSVLIWIRIPTWTWLWQIGQAAMSPSLLLNNGDGTFWVEDGKIKHGIKNLRFTESMLKAFSNVLQVSEDRKIVASWWEDVGCIVAPAMLIDKFKFTGKTEF